MIQLIIHFIANIILATSVRIIQKIVVPLFKIEKNWIGLYAHNRKGIVCNPGYIMKDLERENKYNLFWITQYPNEVPESNKYTVVKYRSIRYFYIYCKCHIFITNDMLDEFLYKRKKQIVIGTWHGSGNGKKSGFSVSSGIYSNYIYSLHYHRIDYFITDSRSNSKFLSEAFRVPMDRFFEYGCARNSVFFKNAEQIVHDVKDFYGIAKNTKILLYAPTYRKDLKQFKHYLSAVEISNIFAALSRKFGGEWICLYRLHYFLKDMSIPVSSQILDGQNYYDIQELLVASDVLISDYSSVIWDFSHTERPVFLYTPDLYEYESCENGFYDSIEHWPYPHSQTVESIINQISLFSQKNYQKKLEKYKADLGIVDETHSLDKIENLIDSLNA